MISSRFFLSFCILFFCILPFSFALDMKSADFISMGESNIALVLGGGALITNPAFLSNQGFSFGKHIIDSGGQKYDHNYYEYFSYNSVAYGSVHYREKGTNNKFDVNLFGVGSQVNELIKWGVTIETISYTNATQKYNTWSSKAGLSYQLPAPNRMFIGLTFEHFFKEDFDKTILDLPPKIIFGIGLIPMDKVLWTHSFEYQRIEGQGIYYNTGIALILAENLVASGGVNRYGYSAGVQIPLSFGKLNNLGKVNYTVLMPYSLNQDIQYSVSYSWGG